MIVHRSVAEARGRHMCERLKDLIPRHLFNPGSSPGQAAHLAVTSLRIALIVSRMTTLPPIAACHRLDPGVAQGRGTRSLRRSHMYRPRAADDHAGAPTGSPRGIRRVPLRIRCQSSGPRPGVPPRLPGLPGPVPGPSLIGALPLG